MLITERPGRLRQVLDGRLLPEPVRGLPPVSAGGQGGLMDVVLHPRYTENRLVYLSYSASGPGGRGTEVARGRLRDRALRDVEVVFRALPKKRGGRHFGSRLWFAGDGALFVTLGDRAERPTAQDLSTPNGSIVRIRDDGSVPPDNPFAGRDDAQLAIYSYGHRNVQGIAWDADTGRLWAHEHGPMGGDELNLIEAGANYGWPVITYGVNYVTGTAIGEGAGKEGMRQPAYYWVPSIAPSGMAWYDGAPFPDWRGSLFVGSLKFLLLVRLELHEGKVVHEERLLVNVAGRIRDVRQGPDGLLYLLTDRKNGELIRLEPAG